MIATKMPIFIELPESCDMCIYYESRPDPYRGWTDFCGLCLHTLDERQNDKEWIYEGNGRVEACPLFEIEEETKDEG